MIKEKWEQILKNEDTRQNLSKIRQEIKDKGNLKRLEEIIAGKEERLIRLLESEDAKTRKNAALLMGDLGMQKFLSPIWDAYQKEEQQFVKSSYLAAIGNFDYRQYLDDMKEQLEYIGKLDVTQENQKHRMEEMRELSALIVRIEGVSAHKFTGWEESYDVVLLTNRNFTETIKDQLLALEPDAKTKLVGAGVMARVKNLKWLKELRTYQELLFAVKGMESCPMEPDQVADMIINSQILNFLSKSHAGKAPYYFRVEMKSKRDLGQKSIFLKKLSAQIEQSSNRQLINTTDHYEFEFRMIENKQGNCNILLKLYTLKDIRFTYRKEVIPSSIKPVNAALTVALAGEYLKEDAQILDPFCGVGTMLIERHKSVRAGTSYGIDIQEDAILKARRNTEIANQVIHYINRDFFQFQHDYLFDEIITNMPFKIGRFTEDEVYEVYKQFFHTIPQFLKEKAILVLYSHHKNFVEQLIQNSNFQMIKEFEISMREGTYVLILRYQ